MIFAKSLDLLFKVVNGICRILLLVIFSTMWIVVFGRYFLGKTPVWGEELVLLSMVWIAMLSGAGAFRKDQHMKITLIDNFLPNSVIQVLQVIYDIIIVFVTCLIFKYAVTSTIGSIGTKYMGLKISEAYAYAAMPVGYGLIVVAKLEKYYRRLLGLPNLAQEEES